MPLFHFNLADHVRDNDEEGTDLLSVAEAREQAIVFAGRYLSDNPGLIRKGHIFKVEVTDDVGKILFKIVIKMIEDGSPEDV